MGDNLILHLGPQQQPGKVGMQHRGDPSRRGRARDQLFGIDDDLDVVQYVFQRAGAAKHHRTDLAPRALHVFGNETSLLYANRIGGLKHCLAKGKKPGARRGLEYLSRFYNH